LLVFSIFVIICRNTRIQSLCDELERTEDILYGEMSEGGARRLLPLFFVVFVSGVKDEEKSFFQGVESHLCPICQAREMGESDDSNHHSSFHKSSEMGNGPHETPKRLSGLEKTFNSITSPDLISPLSNQSKSHHDHHHYSNHICGAKPIKFFISLISFFLDLFPLINLFRCCHLPEIYSKGSFMVLKRDSFVSYAETFKRNKPPQHSLEFDQICQFLLESYPTHKILPVDTSLKSLPFPFIQIFFGYPLQGRKAEYEDDEDEDEKMEENEEEKEDGDLSHVLNLEPVSDEKRSSSEFATRFENQAKKYLFYKNEFKSNL